ncbi:phospholipase effector Tle1 domain-containing protein [Moraxella nonliquefaciens]|uniref:DUF2235 domain-containing protein n=1 Tax=Moraxella nonliquefaciens TaxID=478 RepID=A0A1B8QK53_MORNO|nr:DUF2235 domain-containing protein [Moraxella nonliquefaciens]OBX83885.1 hypothetical protein A7456_10745 [Moraxella nonliquefaciens]QPT45460.1 DUF2235 domain-containing protein [Moraxella nonliquefaciens]QQC30493.1 DUF2235 domain-containing protein [Moraxella nonliquefaciens]
MQNIRAFEMDLDISGSEFKTIVHAVATNENRAEFARRSIYTSQTDANSKNDKTIDGKYRLEKGFLGAHSDIGGGYKDGDLSDVTLVWMANEANKLYKSQSTKTEIKLNTNNKRISNPIVHDSIGVERAAGTIIFGPSRQFRWAGAENGSIE